MTRAKDISKIVTDADLSGTLDVTGAVTANAGVSVDNITIDGTQIDLSSGDLSLDVAGDIILDADGGDVAFRDGGVGHLQISNVSNDAKILSLQTDKDLIFSGIDGGSEIEAMRIDMSAGGSIGIGTSSPSATLQVQGTTNGLQSVFGLDSSGLKISTFQKTGNDAGVILDAQESSNGTLTFATTGSERMRINSAGSVSIGTSSSPNNAPLLIKCATDDNIRISQQTHASIQAVNDAASAFTELKLDGSTLLLNSQSGSNVGIGTSSVVSSDVKLEVKDGIVAITNSAGGDARLFFGESTSPNHSKGQIRYSNADESLEFYSNSAERMRIDSSGRVGIGNTVVAAGDADDLVVGTGTGNRGITIYSANNGSGNIYFSDSTSGNGQYDAYIEYGHTARTLYMLAGVNMGLKIDGTNRTLSVLDSGTERMRIDSSGNLLVGKTNTTANVAGTEIEGSGTIVSTRDNNTNIFLNRVTSTGNLMEFRFNNAPKGILGTDGSSNMYFACERGAGIAVSDQELIPTNANGALTDNFMDVGHPTYRFDDVRATNGTIQTSDRNEKNTITDSDLGIDFIKRLTPKSYIFNGKTRTHYGLIAQDVETVLTDINKPTSGFAGFIKDDISEEQDGSEYRYGLRYTEFVAPLIQAVKDQQATIDALTARITALENGE